MCRIPESPKWREIQLLTVPSAVCLLPPSPILSTNEVVWLKMKYSSKFKTPLWWGTHGQKLPAAQAAVDSGRAELLTAPA